MSLAPAYTMTAPRTADGRYSMGAVRNIRMTAIVPAAARPLTWLVAPMSSLTAVRDPLVPTGMLCVTPAEIWATPNASSSWLASTTSWCRAAKERAVRIESENATRNTARAATTSVPRSARDTSGSSSDGKPARHRAGDRHPVGGEVQCPGRGDAQDHDHECARKPLADPAGHDQERQGQGTDDDGGTVGVAEMTDDVERRRGWSPRRRSRSPSSLPSWPRISTIATPVMYPTSTACEK